MRDLEISTDPADYISGPTSRDANRTQGGTNRSGGVSLVEAADVADEPEQSAPADTPAAEPPAAPAQ